MPRSMEECHELGHHQGLPRQLCKLCQGAKCAGCLVRSPFEHRCLGGGCACTECREEETR